MWGGPANVARAPGGDGLRYTVIPLPVQPSDDFTMQRRAEALAATFQGRLEEAVDLYRGTVEADGWMSGILDTMAHGLLGLPLSFQGDPAMCSALLNADGTPGDFARMHPENECAKIFRDGLGMGFGWGQYVQSCWRCDGVDFDLVETMAGAGATDVCRCCKARRIDRPVGMRVLYQLRWRDARWFYRNPITLQWYYNGRSAQVPVTPGDGEWFLFETVPDIDVWRHGPWVWATIAAIFSRDSSFDAQNTSAVCAPTHVFQAVGGTAPATRQEVKLQADNIQFNNKIVLPGEWKHEIHSADGTYSDVTSTIVERCSGMFEVGITGNLHGMKAGTGFANMDVYARATRERRAFYAGAWIRQIVAQGLTWWGSDNFGTRNVPVGAYDVRSPEDKLAAANADKTEGEAIVSLATGYAAVGYELEPSYIEERAQAKGHRIRPKAAPVSLPTPASAAAPAAPAPPTGGAAPLPADDGADADAVEGARLAAEMNAHGYDRCGHGRIHECPKCGIKRVYSAGPPGPDGAPTFPIAWTARVTPAVASEAN